MSPVFQVITTAISPTALLVPPHGPQRMRTPVMHPMSIWGDLKNIMTIRRVLECFFRAGVLYKVHVAKGFQFFGPTSLAYSCQGKSTGGALLGFRV